MDLGSSSITAGGSDTRSTGALLAEISAQVRAQRQAEIDQFQTIIAWARANTVTDLEGAATIRDSYVDTGLPLAGAGAPLVSEFALIELCATLQRSVDGGREHVGKIIECGWRLPRIRDAVTAGRVPVWKALRVADLTRVLSPEAAGYVDRHLAFALPTCTWVQVERLVAEAIARFDPETAEERRREEQDHRHVHVFTPEAGASTAHVSATLDAADARDLDTAVSRRAKVLGQLGCEDGLDVRRAVALGELARHDLTLDLEVADPVTGEITRTVPGRKVELHVHLTDRTLATGATSSRAADGAVGRWGDTQTPVSAEQVRQWCGLTGSTVIVRPVIDLQDHVPVDSYEIPDRLKTRVRLRDHTCRAPYCNRRAEACDLDHAQPHAQGGPTCPCNLVPLCRRHHRAKTFDYWRYSIVEPGAYLWTSPHHQQWLVNHTGTRPIEPPRALTLPTRPADQTDQAEQELADSDAGPPEP